MLKAYLRRYDGTTQPVTVQHQGQHLGVHEGKVRFARLYWERAEAKGEGEEADFAPLEEAVPLLDTLIVTRVSSVNGERVVFHGTLTEASADDNMLSLIAVDNPATERLYDQAWWNDAPLFPSDQSAPETTQTFAAPLPQPEPQQPQPVQTLGGLAVTQPGQVLPLSQGAHMRVSASPSDPAARPGGHPAAHPAGSWQGSPQAAQQA